VLHHPLFRRGTGDAQTHRDHRSRTEPTDPRSIAPRSSAEVRAQRRRPLPPD
jgi:hypothetical protein